MSLLTYSMFNHVLFPESSEESLNKQFEVRFSQLVRFAPRPQSLIRHAPLVVFDFETTGLDANQDRIIEIGAIKVQNLEIVDEFSTLVDPTIPLSIEAERITGITPDMLVGSPTIDKVFSKLLDFMAGSILVAHNADFDMGFLKAEGRRLGYEIQMPCFCTLKLTRVILPLLESRSLDNLAKHFGLSFEARHRSIGDIKVTIDMLKEILRGDGQHLKTWEDFSAFKS